MTPKWSKEQKRVFWLILRSIQNRAKGSGYGKDLEAYAANVWGMNRSLHMDGLEHHKIAKACAAAATGEGKS